MGIKLLVDTTFSNVDIYTGFPASLYQYTATENIELKVQLKVENIGNGGLYNIYLARNGKGVYHLLDVEGNYMDSNRDSTNMLAIPVQTLLVTAGDRWFDFYPIVLKSGDTLDVMCYSTSDTDTAVDGEVRIATDYSIADIADAVCDEVVTSGHSESGSLAKIIADYLDAAGVRAAIGLGSANLDTQLSTIDTVVDGINTKTTNLPASPAAVGSAMTLTSAYDAAKTAAPTASEIDSQLSGMHGAGAWGSGNGGSKSLVYTLTESGTGNPVEGATIELYGEIGMSTLIDQKITNMLGQVTFSNLVAGTYYLKIIKSGYIATTDTEVVT
jgi:hypothetical protein